MVCKDFVETVNDFDVNRSSEYQVMPRRKGKRKEEGMRGARFFMSKMLANLQCKLQCIIDKAHKMF